MEHFTHNVQEALHSLVGGLELTKPDIKAHEALNARNFTQQAKQNPELIPHFEELLDGWCNQIQQYLDEPDGAKKKDDDDESDVGPRYELEYWRNRMQRLTSIAEQLKRKDCKNVIGLLSTLTKNSADPSKQKVIALLRRWKQIDVNITEAANEAKDNVKYLFTLERFIEPLYTGTATTIIDTLPALTNSIKMIHTIARYYSTTERMTILFAKITDQMIVNCKQSITEGEGFDTLWEKKPQELVRQLESCLKLSEAYQEQYRLTKKKLQQMPKGKQFDFNEMQIFGKFDLFCRRIIKLIDMFSTIDQFTSLSRAQARGHGGPDRAVPRDREGLPPEEATTCSTTTTTSSTATTSSSTSRSRTSRARCSTSSTRASRTSRRSRTSLNLLNKFQSILQRENAQVGPRLEAQRHLPELRHRARAGAAAVREAEARPARAAQPAARRGQHHVVAPPAQAHRGADEAVRVEPERARRARREAHHQDVQ